MGNPEFKPEAIDIPPNQGGGRLPDEVMALIPVADVIRQPVIHGDRAEDRMSRLLIEQALEDKV